MNQVLPASGMSPIPMKPGTNVASDEPIRASQAHASEILLSIAAPLVQAVQAFEASGFAPFRARFHARDALRGRTVVLSDGTTGMAQGTSESGALLVHTAAGMNTVISSEVSVRPAK